MTPKGKSYFGGEMRAADGVIATLELDGVRFSKQFAQVIHTKGGYKPVKTKQPVETPNQQVIDYCDRTGAKVVCLSSPETIMRDLQGTRADLEQRANRKHPEEGIRMPERMMLGGRHDLLLGS